MSESLNTIEQFVASDYKYGFVTNIESDTVPPGLSEDTIRFISAKKNEPAWLTEWRLKAFRYWQTLTEPKWPNVTYTQTDYQAISYYSAPKQKKTLNSLDEVDPELRKTFDKLGISLNEQKRLSGVAVDAVVDSVSVATTFKTELAKQGIIFSSFSEAVAHHPDLIQKYLGSVVPHTDNFYAALNAAVFTDGSFCYIPKGVRCPLELSTYFRINAAETGKFERTLIVADEGAHVSYLEGCTAPKRSTNQLHAAVVELVALDRSTIKSALAAADGATLAAAIAGQSDADVDAACARVPAEGVIAAGGDEDARYLSRLRHIALGVDGDDVRRVAAEEGPEIGRLLIELRRACIDGSVADTRDAQLAWLADDALLRRD